MKSRSLFVLSLSLITSFNATASEFRDLRPAVGETAIWVTKTTVNDRPGMTILQCDYDYSAKKYENCKALGNREFYTDVELETLNSRIASTRYGEFPQLIAGGILASVVGMAGGTAIGSIGGPIGATIGTVVGAVGVLGGTAKLAYNSFKKIDVRYQAVVNGVAQDQNIVLEVEEYNKVIQLLSESLKELD